MWESNIRIHSWVPMNRQLSNPLQKRRAPLLQASFPSFSNCPALYAEHDTIKSGISLWSAGARWVILLNSYRYFTSCMQKWWCFSLRFFYSMNNLKQQIQQDSLKINLCHIPCILFLYSRVITVFIGTLSYFCSTKTQFFL